MHSSPTRNRGWEPLVYLNAQVPRVTENTMLRWIGDVKEEQEGKSEERKKKKYECYCTVTVELVSKHFITLIIRNIQYDCSSFASFLWRLAESLNIGHLTQHRIPPRNKGQHECKVKGTDQDQARTTLVEEDFFLNEERKKERKKYRKKEKRLFLPQRQTSSVSVIFCLLLSSLKAKQVLSLAPHYGKQFSTKFVHRSVCDMSSKKLISSEKDSLFSFPKRFLSQLKNCTGSKRQIQIAEQ